ncbi:MAG: aliphatic sulfonate ABC transporter substrate-binding protein [Clostridiales bacterium]|nr:aliphatic sulfonate ABC transporter substrate-binding protein [Clostridiales bacterium]
MKKKNFVTAIGLSMVLGLGLLAGCGSASTTSTDDTESVDTEISEQAETETASEEELNTAAHLNVAIQPSFSYLPLYILRDTGWLEDALEESGYGDIEITFTEFESGPPENESFAAGQQDVGVMGNVPTISGIASGQERTIIGISSVGEKVRAIMVPTDSDITSVDQLEGKTIGLVVGSISQDFLNTALEEYGLSISDVEVINLNNSEQESALVTNQVDAVVTWEPLVTQLEDSGAATVLIDGTGIYPGENSIFGRTEYLQENPEIVLIFMQQYARAAKELINNKESYAEEYADYFGLSVDSALVILENTEIPVVITEESVANLQNTADFLYSAELTTAEVDVASYVDYSYSEDETVLSYLGE